MFKVGDAVVVREEETDEDVRFNKLQRGVVYRVTGLRWATHQKEKMVSVSYGRGFVFSRRFRHAIWSDYKWNELPDKLVHTTPVYQHIKAMAPGKGREALIYLRKIAKAARDGNTEDWTKKPGWGESVLFFMVWGDFSEAFATFIRKEVVGRYFNKELL